MRIKRISDEDGRTIGIKVRLDNFKVTSPSASKYFHTLQAALKYAAGLIRAGQIAKIYPK